MTYDALLLLSFGGPEGPEDVMPFLANVTRGRGVPRERLLEVAEHYHHFGGKSPINEHNRALRAAIERELSERGPKLRVYWGNRNWHPFLDDTLATMRDDGVTRALAFVTSSFSSYSGCRQYLESLEAARAKLGDGAPVVDKIRQHGTHPLFLAAMVDQVRDALARIPDERRAAAHVVFTAHSIPNAMAATCAYERELELASAAVAEQLGLVSWDRAFQSRSGPPQVPWLEPDVGDHLRALATRGVRDVVVAPIGFVSDHMEVVWDLDHDARDVAGSLGLGFVRAATVGTHEAFVRMVGELVRERFDSSRPRLVVAGATPGPDACAPGCCAYTRSAMNPSRT